MAAAEGGVLLISILRKNHADGDKWLVTEINNFTSILSDLLKNFHKTKHSIFLTLVAMETRYLGFLEIGGELPIPRKNVKLILFRLTFVI